MNSHNFFLKRTYENDPSVRGIKPKYSTISALDGRKDSNIHEMTKEDMNRDAKQTLLLVGESVYNGNSRKNWVFPQGCKTNFHGTLEGNYHTHSGIPMEQMDILERSSSVTRGNPQVNWKNTNLSVVKKHSIPIEQLQRLQYNFSPESSSKNLHEHKGLEKKSVAHVETRIPTLHTKHGTLKEKNLSSCMNHYEKSNFNVGANQEIVRTKLGDNEKKHQLQRRNYNNEPHIEIPLKLSPSSKNNNSLLSYQGVVERESVLTSYIKEDGTLVHRMNQNSFPNYNGGFVKLLNGKSVDSLKASLPLYTSKKKSEGINSGGGNSKKGSSEIAANSKREDKFIQKSLQSLKVSSQHAETTHTQMIYPNGDHLTNIHEPTSVSNILSINNKRKEGAKHFVEENAMQMKEKKHQLNQSTTSELTKHYPNQYTTTSELITDWPKVQNITKGYSREEMNEQVLFTEPRDNTTLHGIYTVPLHQQYVECNPLRNQTNENSSYKKNESIYSTQFTDYKNSKSEWNVRKATLKGSTMNPLMTVPRIHYIQQRNPQEKDIDSKYFSIKETTPMVYTHNENKRIIQKFLPANAFFSGINEQSKIHKKNEIGYLNQTDMEYMFSKNSSSVPRVKRSNTNIIPARTMMTPLQVPSSKNVKRELDWIGGLSKESYSPSGPSGLIYFDSSKNKKAFAKEGNDPKRIHKASHAIREQMQKPSMEYCVHDQMNILCVNEKGILKPTYKGDKHLEEKWKENSSYETRKFTSCVVDKEDKNDKNSQENGIEKKEREEILTNSKESIIEGATALSSIEGNQLNISLPDLQKFYQISQNGDHSTATIELYKEKVDMKNSGTINDSLTLHKNGKDHMHHEVNDSQPSLLNPYVNTSSLMEKMKGAQNVLLENGTLSDSQYEEKRTKEKSEKEKLIKKSTIEEMKLEEMKKGVEENKENGEIEMIRRNGSSDLLNEHIQKSKSDEQILYRVNFVDTNESIEKTVSNSKKNEIEISKKEHSSLEEPLMEYKNYLRKENMKSSFEPEYIQEEKEEGIVGLKKREFLNEDNETENGNCETCVESRERPKRHSNEISFPWDKDDFIKIKRRSDLNTKEGIIMNTKLARYERVLIHTCINNLKWKKCNDNINKGIFHWIGYNLNDFDHYNYTKKRKIINRIPSIYTYTKKKALTFLLSHLSFIYPHLFNFYPATFVLPENKHILNYVLNQNSGCNEANKDYYIMKPDSGSMGIGVKLINKYSDIHISILNGYNSYIIQKYIDNPLLMYKKKFDFRIYVLLIPDKNYPKVFLSKIGFARLCTEEYKKKKKTIGNTYVHLTNYSINKDSENYIRKKNIHDKSNNKQLLSDVFIYLKNHGYDTDSIWSQIKKISCLTSLAIYSYLKTKIKFNYKNSFNFYQLIGLDILLDDVGKAWLLEVNSNPSLRIDYTDPNYSFFEIQLESMFDRYVKEPVISEMFHIVYRKIYKKYFKNNSKKGLDRSVISKCGISELKGKKKKKRKEDSVCEDPNETFSKKFSNKKGVCLNDYEVEHQYSHLRKEDFSRSVETDVSLQKREHRKESIDSSLNSTDSSNDDLYGELNDTLIEPSQVLGNSSMSNIKIKNMLKKRSKMTKQSMTKNEPVIGSMDTCAGDGEINDNLENPRNYTVSFKKDSNEMLLNSLTKELMKNNSLNYEENNFVLHKTEIKKEHNSVYLHNSNEIHSNKILSNEAHSNKMHSKIRNPSSRLIPVESKKRREETLSDSDCSCDSYDRRRDLMNAYSTNSREGSSDFVEINQQEKKKGEDDDDEDEDLHEEAFNLHSLNLLHNHPTNTKNNQQNKIKEEADPSENCLKKCQALLEESNFVNKDTYIQVNDQTDIQLNQILNEDLECYKNIYKNISDSVYRKKIENLMMIRTSLYKYMNCLNVLGIRYANNDFNKMNESGSCKPFNGEYKKVYTKIRKDILHPLKKNILEKNIYVDLKKDMCKYYDEMKLYNKCLFLYEYVLKKYDVNLKRKKKKFEYPIDKNAFMSMCKDIQIYKLIENIEIVPTVVTTNNGKINENIKNTQDIQMYQKIKEGLKNIGICPKKKESRNTILHGSITEERTSILSHEKKVGKRDSLNNSDPEGTKYVVKEKSSYSQIGGFCPFSFNSTTNHLMNLNTRSMNNLKIKKKKKKINIYDIEFLFVRQVFFNKYINKNLGLTVIDFFLLMQQLSLLVFPFISYLSLYNVLYPYQADAFEEMNRRQELTQETTELEKSEAMFCKQNTRPSPNSSLINPIRKSFKGKRKVEKDKRTEKEEDSSENRLKRESRIHSGNTTRVLKKGKDKRSTSMKLQNGTENKLERNSSIMNKTNEKKQDPNLWHKHICNNVYNLYEYTQIHVSTEVKNICLETFLTFVFTKFGITYTAQ